ncbi:protein SIX6OS1 [Mantella aurantiaca]
MNEVDFSVFDKLLLESVFQSEQESQKKNNIKEYIQHCTAKSLQENQHIFEIRKEIGSCDETISDLQKYNTENNESVTRYISSCTVLDREEAFHQSQLESVKNESENDRNKYQDSMSKYKEVLKQYQEQYMESTLAKNYHSIKQDFDSIQDVILKLDEQCLTKEKSVMDALEPIPFKSYSVWGLQLAKVKKNTNETLELISEISHTTLELTADVNRLEQKIEYINKHIENVARQDNNKKNKVPDQTMKFQKKIFSEGNTSLTQPKGKRSPTLHLPDFPQKLIQPLRDIKLALQPDEPAGRSEKELDHQQCSSTVLSQDRCMENDNQEPLINVEKENSAIPATWLHHQGQLRLILPQRQIPQNMGIKEIEIRKEQITSISNASKDSGYCSQAEHGSCEDHSNGKVSEHEVFALPKVPSFAVPETPAKTAFVKKVHFSKDKNGQNFHKSSDKSFSAPVEQTEKSPYFSTFKTSTPKTNNFGTFESPYRSVKFADQSGSYSSVDMSTSSPVKDFESIFGGMEGDDNFAFPFNSKPSQTSEEEKNNFGFRFPFCQDMRPSKDFSLKESEQSQSKMNFTFF